jgi:hypothetical protein
VYDYLKEHDIEHTRDEVVPEGEMVVVVPPIGNYAQDIAKIIADMVGVTLALSLPSSTLSPTGPTSSCTP